MKRMLRLLPYAALALTPISSQLLAGYTSDPVGAVKVTIKGNGGSGTAVSYMGVPFHRGNSFVGTVTGVGSSSLTCSGASWTTNTYANAYYVEITTGAYAGVAATITANTATTLTLAEDLSAFSPNGQSLAIRKYTTLADVFGPNNEAGLKSGATLTDADEVIIYDAGSQSATLYYYKQGGRTGGNGWRTSGDLSTNRSGVAIIPGTGITIRRKSSNDLSIYINGSVGSSNSLTPIFPQTNIISSQYPKAVTLAQYFGATGGQLRKGATVGNADQVLVPSNGSFDIYYYKQGGRTGGDGWRKSDDLSTNKANQIIAQPSGAFILVRKFDPAFNLTETKPY